MSHETSGSNRYRARFLLVAGCSLVAIAAAELCGTCSIGFFYRAAKIRQNYVSYQVDIGQNPSSVDTTSTNRRVNARFWLHKRIWETYGMAMYTSVCD